MAHKDDAREALPSRKSVARLAILQLLHEEDRYGYEIVAEAAERTSGVVTLAEGNVYPALHALEKDGHLESYWREIEADAPPRKYYHITPRGDVLRRRLVHEWQEYARAVDCLIYGGSLDAARRAGEALVGADDDEGARRAGRTRRAR